MTTPANSVTAYDLLTYAIRTAQSISTEQKQHYLSRLAKGTKLDAVLRKELAELCRTEAALRKRRAEQQQMFINEVKESLPERSETATEAMNDVETEFTASMGAIQSAFINDTNAVERETNRAYEQVGKGEDSAEIDSLRAFLQQDNA